MISAQKFFYEINRIKQSPFRNIKLSFVIISNNPAIHKVYVNNIGFSIYLANTEGLSLFRGLL